MIDSLFHHYVAYGVNLAIAKFSLCFILWLLDSKRIRAISRIEEEGELKFGIHNFIEIP